MKLNIIGASVVSALLFSAAASAADPVIVNGGTVHFTRNLLTQHVQSALKAATRLWN